MQETPLLGDAEAVEIYARDGRRISFREFSHLRHDPGYRLLARDSRCGVDVVTVWLGLDQGCGDTEPPLIFATAVAGGDREIFAATEAEALASHAALLAELSEEEPSR